MTTRLSNSAKGEALAGLRCLLNNVVGFVKFPVTDRAKMVELWNSKSPPDLGEAVKVLGTYSVGLGTSGGFGIDKLRWGTEIDGKLHCALVDIDEVGPVSSDQLRAGIPQYPIGYIGLLTHRGYYKNIRVNTNDVADHTSKYQCHEITPDEMRTFLGADLTDEVISWMKQCAVMREELIIANKALQEIFDMAQTAGQIKRMVPDLLQYLPARQRAAFEEQKRASTVPFEWAPFPKANVDVMLAQINKGHLLHNMRKPGQGSYTVETLDHINWARSDVRWVKT